MTIENEDLGCTDGCGAKVKNVDGAIQAGWICLQITNRYRCVECYTKLREANEQYKREDAS